MNSFHCHLPPVQFFFDIYYIIKLISGMSIGIRSFLACFNVIFVVLLQKDVLL